MALLKLTHSDRLNALLHKMGIYSYYDVVNHLPRRYDDYSITHERDLLDKERITIYAKIISNITLSKSLKRISIATFEVLTDKNTYFKVVAYNRPYLAKNLKLNSCVTIIGTFDKKKNIINLINVINGKVSQSKTLRPIYSLPKDYANKDFVSLVGKSLKELKG